MIVARDVPHEFYMEALATNIELAYSAVLEALRICTEKLPLDISAVQKIERVLDSLRRPDMQQFITSIKDAIRIITAPDDVTSSVLGMNAANASPHTRMSMATNALNHGKEALAREFIATFSDSEKFEILKAAFASAGFIKPSELKAASQLYNMLPEEVRRPVHETEEYLKAAVHYLKLEQFRVLAEGDYKLSLTFRASPEQVAAGYLQEMTYLVRRNGGPIFNLMAQYGFYLKFTSADAFDSFISHDLRSIFPDWTENIISISKNTLNLIGTSSYLRDRLPELGYKIMTREAEFLEYLNETAIENVPSMGNLIRETFVLFDMLAKINDPATFTKLEKFTDTKISSIAKNALERLNRKKMSQVDYFYFKIRNALVYWAEGPMIGQLNELPVDLKNLLVKEFPNLTDILTLV